MKSTTSFNENFVEVVRLQYTSTQPHTELETKYKIKLPNLT